MLKPMDINRIYMEFVKRMSEENSESMPELKSSNSRTECVMLKKIGPFEKWDVIESDPMFTVKLFGKWYFRYSRKNYQVI